MTVQQALADAMARGLPRLDAQLLLLHCLQRPPSDRAWLLAHDQDVLPAAVLPLWQSTCARRLAGEPLAYINGHKEFFGLNLQVGPEVLVPRPETETLVEWALALLHEQANAQVLDLGTGSGAVALAIKASRGDWQLWASDASAAALAVAQANAQRLGLAVQWRQGDWLHAVPGQRFDLIVSNPPYIAAHDAHLQALRHEPLLALTSGEDGLQSLRQIICAAPACLKPGAWLLLEHGHDQAAAVRERLLAQGFEQVQSRNDLAGIARCTGGRLGTMK